MGRRDLCAINQLHPRKQLTGHTGQLNLRGLVGNLPLEHQLTISGHRAPAQIRLGWNVHDELEIKLTSAIGGRSQLVPNCFGLLLVIRDRCQPQLGI